jgi:NAD(P)H-dependent FMN reductase
MSKSNIVTISGSSRKDSFNSKLKDIAAKIAVELGANVTNLSLEDYDIPLYNQDREASEGTPADVLKLKSIFNAADGIIVVSPEYNSSISPLLKNTIDWISRKQEDETPMAGFRGKAALLLSASPGALGGMRGLVHVRDILGNIGMHVMPDQLSVGSAHEAFDTEKGFKDESKQKKLHAMVAEFIRVSSALKSD